MSWPAVHWAFAQRAPSSAAKFLLIVLADNAAVDDWRSWPSIPYLVETTQQDRKTVMKNLRALEDAALIAPVGKAGRTGQVTVWRLPVVTAHALAKKPKNGTASEDETVPNFPRNSTKFPAKQYQKRDTEPVKEPVNEPGASRAPRSSGFDASSIDLPDWLPRSVWTDWVEDRKERRKPISSRAAGQQIKRLEDYRSQGIDPARVIEHSIANGYQGLFPPNDAPRGAAQSSTALPTDHLFT